MTNKMRIAAEKAEKQYMKETPEVDRAMGAGAGEYALGPHRFLPAVAWVRGECLVIIGFLLRMQENKTVGSLAWSLPYTPNTAYVLGDLMATLGWNGRVWPPEPGKEEGVWPTDEDEVRGLRYLMAGRNIQRTFTFPTTEEGNVVLTINMQRRAKVDFPLDPRPYITREADMAMRDELHRFVSEPDLF